MDLIQKVLNYKGTVTTVYFRELTAGEQLQLTKGQTYKGNPKSGTVEVDVYSNAETRQKLVQMTLVDADGMPVYASLKKLQDEPASKVEALSKLAQEAQDASVPDGEDDSGNA